MIEDVFTAVQSGTASHGVVPFENSSNGPVGFTLELFANLRNKHPDILVCGEIYLPVHHCLLGRIAPSQTEPAKTVSGQARSGDETPRVKPLHNIDHIKTIHTHPQAWGQCKLFLSTYLPDTKYQDASSTSKAAEVVAQDTTGSSAAISSRLAADLNGLDILAENIEDNERNNTRFFIIRRQQDIVAPDAQDENVEMTNYKTLVLFTVEHDKPGTLVDRLTIFSKHNLNLTGMPIKPLGDGRYLFFFEFMGRKRADGGGVVNEALRELEATAKSIRWLGSWSIDLNA